MDFICRRSKGASDKHRRWWKRIKRTLVKLQACMHTSNVGYIRDSVDIISTVCVVGTVLIFLTLDIDPVTGVDVRTMFRHFTL